MTRRQHLPPVGNGCIVEVGTTGGVFPSVGVLLVNAVVDFNFETGVGMVGFEISLGDTHGRMLSGERKKFSKIDLRFGTCVGGNSGR